jgi:glycosyltransferase involved in cell wall biosynthesis
MPVYNGERFVARAIESLLAQTYTDFELVISDNASTDRTQEICAEYALRDPRIRYVRQAVNLGAAANFRYVMNAATHDRFIWAAADDWWSADRLERLVEALRSEDAAVIGEIRRYVDEMAVAVFVPVSFAKDDWWRFLMREESRCEKTYYIYGLLWRDRAIKAFAEFVDNYSEDNVFCYRLLWMGNLTSIPGAALHVTLHHDSAGASESAGFRYSMTRLLYRAYPWGYYNKFLAAAPIGHRNRVRLALPFKALASQLHLWWRAVRRIVFGRPYVHGAVDGGERIVHKAGL